MTADIFFGVIHYQRLRHMVSDKFQVRISSKCQIDKIRAKLFDKNGAQWLFLEILVRKFKLVINKFWAKIGLKKW